MIIGSDMLTTSEADLHAQNKKKLEECSESWTSVTRGSPLRSYSNSVFGKYVDLDAILKDSCDHSVPYALTGNSTAENSTISAPNKTCLGLEKLVHGFVAVASELNEDLYTAYYSKSVETTRYFSNIYFDAVAMYELLNQFIVLFVEYTKYSQNYITITSSVVGLIVVIVLNSASFMSMNDYFSEIHSLRILLNHLPKHVIESSSVMVDYVLNYRLPSTVSRFMSFINKNKQALGGVTSDDDNFSMTRAILNSAVDGSIVCNPKGEILLFNPAGKLKNINFSTNSNNS